MRQTLVAPDVFEFALHAGWPTMFGFFRRIKAALAPTPDAAQAPSVDAAQPPSVDAWRLLGFDARRVLGVDARWLRCIN
ncbi:MAG: hypothetical protein EBV92_09935, partial [Betaproteobacteria bacterium]|nr:hypothetical protein [Betaproteobacteria bacterium]